MNEATRTTTDLPASEYAPPAIERREPVEGLLNSDGGGLGIFVTS